MERPGVILRQKDDRLKQRRGSIKSRIIQFSKKRKTEPPDRNQSDDSPPIRDTGQEREVRIVAPDIEVIPCPSPPPSHHYPHLHQPRPPVKRRYDPRQRCVTLRDPGISNGNGTKTRDNGSEFMGPSTHPSPIRINKNECEFGQNQTSSDTIKFSDSAKLSAHPKVQRPTELFIDNGCHEYPGPGNGTGLGQGSVYDYSFMSSCSLPSEQSSPVTTPSPPTNVMMRHNKTIHNNATLAGRQLNSALSRHFRKLQCNRDGMLVDADDELDSTSTCLLSDNLYLYIKDVFNQLDSGHTGHVTRQDFECLCEILELDLSPVVDKRCHRVSGLQWLSSYQPRPGTPASPIRLDKINEADFKSANKSTATNISKRDPAQHQQHQQQTSFLWTIGPRPFWELWPHKRHKKKKLNLNEFIQCLLLQWAKTHHYPQELAYATISEQMPHSNKNDKSSKSAESSHAQLRFQDDSQFQRLRRSMVRLTRRYHKQERIARNGTATQHQQNGHTNGGNNYQNYNFPRKEKSNFGCPLMKQSSKITKLEKQLEKHQFEIQSLKDCVTHLRGSLQLSDAQNLALQVLLKKMTKAESHLPLLAEKSEFRHEMKKSEQQLENLVLELKEMSQTKYPTFSHSTKLNGSASSYSKTHDLGTEDDLLSVHDPMSVIRLGTTHHPPTNRVSLHSDKINDLPRDSKMLEAYQALLKTEKEIESLRKSLLLEIKATKDVLMSSLKNVQDLEVESRKVPQLEARIEDLEKFLPFERSGKISFAAPESILDDSFMMYTSSEDDIDTTRCDLGLPPRPPSTRSKEKMFDCVSPSPEMSCPTPSSGHFSGGSAMSKSAGGETKGSLVSRLRKEIDILRSRLTAADKQWSQEKQELVSEISRIQSQQRDNNNDYYEDLKQEKIKLTLIEQKIKEILLVLKSLNSMKISRKKLGSIVISVVEEAYSEQRQEVDVVRFLNLLYVRTSEYERQAADVGVADALRAVGDISDTDDTDSDTVSSIIRPSGARKTDSYTSFFRIDV